MEPENNISKNKDAKMNNATKLVIAIIVVVFVGSIALVAGKFATNERGGKFGRGSNIGYEYGRGDMMRGGGFEGRGGMMGKQGTRTRRGLTGDVFSISGSNMVFKVNNNEYAIIVSDTTSFEKAGNIAKFSDVQTGNSISVIGQSNKDGQILAQRIVIN